MHTYPTVYNEPNENKKLIGIVNVTNNSGS